MNEEEFFELFNKNLPNDIRALSIQKVGDEFNIIQSSKRKEYQYLFSFGHKNHPFCAPFMTNITYDLDLELMKEGAKLFEGEHYFGRFCKQPKEGVSLIRKIDYCEIKENDILTASFFSSRKLYFSCTWKRVHETSSKNDDRNAFYAWKRGVDIGGY